MDVTFDIKALLVVLVLIALIILIIYAILLLRKLLVTVDETNKVLEEVEVVTNMAAGCSEEVGGIIENVSSAAADLSDAVSGTSVVSTVGSVAKAAASLRGIISGDDDEETRAAKKKEKKSTRNKK